MKKKHSLFNCIFVLFFVTAPVVSQNKESPDSKVIVVSAPTNSIKQELIAQRVVENRKETVTVYIIFEEFDNTKSLNHKVDSFQMHSFLVYQGKSVKFDLIAKTVSDHRCS